jgi:uncharacterized protein (TIGR02145 family)
MTATSPPRTRQLAIFFAVLLLCATTLGHAGGPESAYPVQVDSGWNLLSLPTIVVDGRTTILYPSAVTPAFVFGPAAGYDSRDSIENGIGFWLKFSAADTFDIAGTDVFADTIDCQAGWNMIGMIVMPVDTMSIATEPPGLIASEFFEYVTGIGYRQVDTLRPGHGYWVKIRESGLVILPTPWRQPCPGLATVEYEGETYHTVQIGSQCWLQENLDVGAMVAGSQYQTNNGTIEKYCYNDSVANCGAYGGLYQWNEAMQYDTIEGGRGICPPGWHIPSDADFWALKAKVGEDGNALKAIGQGDSAGEGTNTSGFSALLAGWCRYDGYFGGLGHSGTFWGSAQEGFTDALFVQLHSTDAEVVMWYNYKFQGFSVRCLKD